MLLVGSTLSVPSAVLSPVPAAVVETMLLSADAGPSKVTAAPAPRPAMASAAAAMVFLVFPIAIVEFLLDVRFGRSDK
jgi:hypothetical protein